MLNFNDVTPDATSGEFELIPNNTVARVTLQLEGGDIEIPEFGRGNFFKASQGGSKAKWMQLVFTIVGGNYNARKVWHKLFVDGDKMSDRNQPIAKEIGLRTMRSIIESSRNIKPDDTSPNAQQLRNLNSIEDLNGMELCIKIGIEKGTNGYADRNKMIVPLTPADSSFITGQQSPTQQQATTQPTQQSSSQNGNVPDLAK